MAVIAVPKVLRERLTDDGADALVSLINESNEKNKQDIIVLVEEKFERRLAEEIGKLRAELIKLMFIFWIGQFAAIVGTLSIILFAFFKR